MTTEFRHLPAAVHRVAVVEWQTNRAATRTVCALATDAADATFILDVLGLNPRDPKPELKSKHDTGESDEQVGDACP